MCGSLFIFRIFQMCTQPVVFFTHTRTANDGSSFKLHAIRDCSFLFHKCNQLMCDHAALARVLRNQSIPQLNRRTKLKSINENIINIISKFDYCKWYRWYSETSTLCVEHNRNRWTSIVAAPQVISLLSAIPFVRTAK